MHMLDHIVSDIAAAAIIASISSLLRKAFELRSSLRARRSVKIRVNGGDRVLTLDTQHLTPEQIEALLQILRTTPETGSSRESSALEEVGQ